VAAHPCCDARAVIEVERELICIWNALIAPLIALRRLVNAESAVEPSELTMMYAPDWSAKF
jgi:hypothetical protein